jgi:hypothetical protein
VHSHTGKIVDWKLDENFQYKANLWGCTDCDELFPECPSNGVQEQEHTHTEYVDGCFACKVVTLHLDAGDAKSGLIQNGYTQKSWNKELDLYKSARAQGIQPDGTSTAKIRQAIDISNKTGHAYGSKLQ